MPKSDNQKLKLLYIADYLMRETDADKDGNLAHGVLLYEIKDYLKDKGIEAEEHSIRRDIDLLCGGKDFALDPVLDVRGGKGKPIYLGSRLLRYEDLEIIIECIASAKFISRNMAVGLIDKLKPLCSKYQAESLMREYVVAERPKYTEKKMLKQLRNIKEAIKNNQKISFIYTRHSPKNITQTENRRKGDRYIVSPFKVVLSDGNHYLIGYDDKYHMIMAYRIDRMDDVRVIEKPREGEDKYKRMRIQDYARQTFGMFIGDNADYITIQFENSLLDAMIDRFGYNDIQRIDDKHFTVRPVIVESENFYGWLCGFGKKAIIIDPPETAGRFKDYLLKISENYT